MIKAGITGGIGSGKSIVCRVFKLLGVPVYNADTGAKILSDTDVEIKNELIKLFGNDIYNGHILNRKLFSEIIFNDDKALKNTNKIFHHRVKEHFRMWSEPYINSPYILMEAAILFESGTYKLLDKIITVSAPEKLRISRVLSKESFNKQIINNIIKSQLTEEEKIKQSDYVIYNDNKTLILPQILEIHQKLISISKD